MNVICCSASTLGTSSATIAPTHEIANVKNSITTPQRPSAQTARGRVADDHADHDHHRNREDGTQQVGERATGDDRRTRHRQREEAFDDALLHVVASEIAVVSAPKASVWTKIPGIR